MHQICKLLLISIYQIIKIQKLIENSDRGIQHQRKLDCTSIVLASIFPNLYCLFPCFLCMPVSIAAPSMQMQGMDSKETLQDAILTYLISCPFSRDHIFCVSKCNILYWIANESSIWVLLYVDACGKCRQLAPGIGLSYYF